MKHKELNWSVVWFWFFTVTVVTFAVLFVLRITKEIAISWWWVFTPLIAASGVPILLLIVSLIIDYLKGGWDD